MAVLNLLSSGAVNLTETGQIVDQIGRAVGYYPWPLSSNTEHCSLVNTATEVYPNDPFVSDIQVDQDYTLTGGTVVVLMGGVDITSSAYSTNKITIEHVTGEISIRLIAIKIPVTIITINDSQQFKYDYGISFLEIGTITNTSRALPIQKVNITGSVSFLEIGTETNTSKALPIEKVNLTGSISFIEMGTETITTT